MEILRIAALAVLYFITGKGGLLLDAVGGFAAAVWPPTGLSLFALYIFGLRLWPGVFLGAFTLNLSAGAPVLAASGIAFGNTVEACLGAFLLARFVQFNPALARLRDAAGLVIFAAFISTLVSATIGTLSGVLGGVISAEHAGRAWRTWWIGDMLSDLVIAPFLFTAWHGSAVLTGRQLKECALLFASLTVTCALVFLNPGADGQDQPYIIFPLLIWAALRLGPREVSAAFALTLAIAVIGTVGGNGPFVKTEINESLLALQTFMGVVALTGLFLAAAVAERNAAAAALTSSELSLRAMVDEKELLLKEIHHRVKNNLQIITSLINLQAMSTKDAAMNEFFHVTQRRVRSMALIHEQLYKSSDLTAIDMGDYIRTLAREMSSAFETAPGKVSLSVNADSILLSLDKAIPCGLLLQELISNCYKHAFPGGMKGELAVSLTREPDGMILLKVRDSGVGVAADLDLKKVRTLGLRIVHTLAQQLGAEVRIEPRAGTCAEVRFTDLRKGRQRSVSDQALRVEGI